MLNITKDCGTKTLGIAIEDMALQTMVLKAFQAEEQKAGGLLSEEKYLELIVQAQTERMALPDAPADLTVALGSTDLTTGLMANCVVAIDGGALVLAAEKQSPVVAAQTIAAILEQKEAAPEAEPMIEAAGHKVLKLGETTITFEKGWDKCTGLTTMPSDNPTVAQIVEIIDTTTQGVYSLVIERPGCTVRVSASEAHDMWLLSLDKNGAVEATQTTSFQTVLDAL